MSRCGIKRKALHNTNDASNAADEFVANISRAEVIELSFRDEFVRKGVLLAYEEKLRTILMKEIENFNSNPLHDDIPSRIQHIKHLLHHLPFNRIRERWQRWVQSINLVDSSCLSDFLDFICDDSFISDPYNNHLIVWEYAIELSYLLQLYAITPNRDLNQITVVEIRHKPSGLTTHIATHMNKPMVMLAILLAGRSLEIDWTAETYNRCSRIMGFTAYYYAWMQVETMRHFQMIGARVALLRRLTCVIGEELSLLGTQYTSNLLIYAGGTAGLVPQVFHIFATDDHSDFLYNESLLIHAVDVSWGKQVNQRRITYREQLKTMGFSAALNGIRVLWMIVLSFIGNPSVGGLIA